MLLPIKLITGKAMHVEYDPSTPVSTVLADLCKEVAASNGKLIFKGRILKPECLVSELSFGANEFLIFHYSPTAKVQKPSEPAKPAEPIKPSEPAKISEPAKPSEPAKLPEPTNPSEPAKASAIQPPKSEAAKPAAAQPTPQRPLLNIPNPEAFNANLETLKALGDFKEEDCYKALVAAYNDPNRAAEFLFSGHIPELPHEQAHPPAAANPAPSMPGQHTAFQNEEIARSVPVFSPKGLELRKSISNISKLVQEKNVMQFFDNLLGQIAITKPEIARMISQNPKKLLALLGMHIMEDSNLKNYSPEERDAIRRLIDLGFDPQTVIQVYEACDKNENSAANVLFSMRD